MNWGRSGWIVPGFENIKIATMFKIKLPTWFVLILPAILILVAVVLIPLLLSLYSSFTPYRLTRPDTLYKWIGTYNYEKAAKSWVFWSAFGRTVLLLTIALNLEMLLGLGLALLVSRVTRGQRALRTVMMFPMMFSPILVGFQFKFIFNDNVGLVNNALQSLGVTTAAIPWLVDQKLAMFSIIFAEVWTSTSVFAILILAGLFAIPKDPLEAAKVDLKDLDPDFYVFSAHKMYGPSGLGVLYMKDKWIDEFTPYQGGGQMIHDVDIDKSTYANGYEKFEAGTPPIAPVIGFSSSLNFMNEVDPNVIYDHEMKLHDYAYEKLSKFNNIKIYGSNKNKGAIISFNIEGVHNSDLGAMLDKKNIAIRTGHHCCQPLMKHFNVTGTSRISFGVYNTKDDVDYLVDSIHEITKILL